MSRDDPFQVAPLARGTNLEFAAEMNRRIVLEAIRDNGAISRAELAKLTRLTAQAISNIAAELITQDLVVTRERVTGQRGPRPTLYSINRFGRFTIGLHLEPYNLVGVATDLEGGILSEYTSKLEGERPAITVGIAQRAIEKLLEATPIDRKACAGVGVALPGIVREGALTDIAPDNAPEWRGYPFARKLGELVAMPVLLANDATAAAIGERHHGIGQRYRTFYFVYHSIGIGGCLIVNGAPYRGAHGEAGEIGHVWVREDGPLCTCGERGCLEQSASLHSLQQVLKLDAEDLRPDRLEAIMAAGHPGLDAWLDQAARHLRRALHTLRHVVNPEAFVIGGDSPQQMVDALITRIGPLDIPVLRAKHLRRGAALGASASAFPIAEAPAAR